MDYSRGSSVAAAGTLPMAGGASIWYVIASVALIGAGMCLVRFFPKKES